MKIPAKFLKAVTTSQVKEAMEADGYDFSLVWAIAFDGGIPHDACYSDAEEAKGDIRHYREKIAEAAYFASL